MNAPLEAIRSVLDYNWADEEADYSEQIRLGEIEHNEPSHVFTQLKIVNAWLVGEELQEER